MTGHEAGVVVTGASGRMGQTLIRLLAAGEGAPLKLVGALERPGHPWLCLLYTSPSPRD